jgi:hypothetical protein
MLPTCVNYTVTRAVYHDFLILPEPHSPNRKSYLDHNASIDADFLKKVPFGAIEVCNENLRGHICPKNWKKLTIAQA